MNTSFIKQGWREKFERVRFPYNTCIFRSLHPAAVTPSVDRDAQDPGLHTSGNKLRKYTQHHEEFNPSAQRKSLPTLQ